MAKNAKTAVKDKAVVQAVPAESTKQLEVSLRALKTLQEQTERQAASWRADINRIVNQLNVAEASCRSLGQQIAEVTKRLFARAAVTPELVAARSTYLELVRRAKSDEITVRQQTEMQAANTIALASLQENCTHPFVFSYDGYGGSYSVDRDDAHCGHRVCTLCNLREESQSTRTDMYEILVEDTTRLVRRDLRKEGKLPMSFQEEWFPVEFLKQLFEASAGDINIRWPAAIDKASVLKF